MRIRDGAAGQALIDRELLGSRAAAIVSIADIPGGMTVSTKTQIRSPSAVLTSSPTMIVSSAGAIARISIATSIRS